MKWWLKYLLIPGLALGATVGASVGTTLHLNNEKHKNDYKLGYENALTNEEYYKQQLGEYHDLVAEQNVALQDYVSKVATLDEENKQKDIQINTLQDSILQKETLISSLQADITLKENEISSLNGEKAKLNTQIEGLQDTISQNDGTISELRKKLNEATIKIGELEGQIENLNGEISRLKKANSDAQETITQNETNIENYKKQVSELNATIGDLRGQTSVNQQQIDSLTKAKTNLEGQIETLTADNAQKAQDIINANLKIVEYENDIALKTQQIKTLTDNNKSMETQILTLTNDNNLKSQEILTLKGSIQTLESNIRSLQTTNELNLKTIDNLNTQVTQLSSQIVNLQEEINNNNLTNKQYKAKIDELEKSIQYYQSYISSLEDDAQAVVTFMFNGAVYNLQIVNKGSFSSVVNPESTDYVIFNYWMADGEKIDLSSYPITKNCIIVANVTYKYSVKYQTDSGYIDTQIVEKDAYPTKPNDPSKDGYEFDGWTLDGVSVIDPLQTQITADTVFIAKFTKIHTVTFNDGVNEAKTYKIRNGEYLSEIPDNPSKENFEFDGWVLTDGIVNPKSVLILKDETFNAKWTELFTVTYNINGDQTTERVRDGEYVKNIPTNTAKDGYDFDGWLSGDEIVNPSSKQITKNTTFTAKYTKLHSVQIVIDEENTTTQKVRDGEKISPVLDPSKPGYEFDGWQMNGEEDFVNPNDQKIQADTIFTAKFTQLFTVKIIVNGQTSIQTVRNGEKIKSITDPSLNGYEFDGWIKDNNGGFVNPNNEIISADTTFTAKFTKLHQVIINIDGYITTQTVRDGERITPLETPSKYNYEFDGWVMNNGESFINPNEQTITDDTTFTAKFTRLYTVTFMFNNNSVNRTVREGEFVQDVPTNTDKVGFEFDGWKLNSGSSIVDPKKQAITSDTTFYAAYTQLFTVTYDIAGNKTTETVRDGEYVKSVPINTLREGYEFDGWYMNNITSTFVNPASVVITQNTTFTAKYTQLFTVTFSIDNDNKTQTVRDGQKVAKVDTPSKKGYDFDGWLYKGNLVDPLSITITEDTTFTAKFTQRHTVKFDNNGSITTQSVRHGEFANLPNTPVRQDYDFDGWTVNNGIVDVTKYAINSDVTFTAKFTRLYSVTFNDGVSTQTLKVRNGEKAVAPSPSFKQGMAFESWLLDGANVDVGSITITCDTLFTARYYYLMDGNYKISFGGKKIGVPTYLTFSIVDTRLTNVSFDDRGGGAMFGFKNLELSSDNLYATFTFSAMFSDKTKVDVSFTFTFDKYSNTWALTNTHDPTQATYATLERV